MAVGVMLDYRVEAHGCVATAKQAEIVLDTDLARRLDAFNPAGLLLASVAGCMLKGIKRVTPMIQFERRGGAVKLQGLRQDSPETALALPAV